MVLAGPSLWLEPSSQMLQLKKEQLQEYTQSNNLLIAVVFTILVTVWAAMEAGLGQVSTILAKLD